MIDIFIGYAREDVKIIEALSNALITLGWRVWYAESGLEPGKPYDEQITEAIDKASVALVVWTRVSLKKQYVRGEAAYAVSKNKLLSVILEDFYTTEPMLLIQAVKIIGWDGNTDDLNFQELVSKLWSLLDKKPRPPPEPFDITNPSSPGGILASCRALWRLCFPTVGPGFDQYFAERTFYIVPAGGILGFALITFFGVIDVLDHAGADQTFYRVMIGGPSLVILLALSFFTRWATQYSQKVALVTCIVGLLVVFKCSQSIEDTFPVTTGAATTTFLVSLALFMVMPLRTLNATIVSLLVLVMHETYILWTHKPVQPGLHAGYSICVLSAGMSLVAVAYFRELLMRKSFLDKKRDAAKIDELNRSLRKLAAQER